MKFQRKEYRLSVKQRSTCEYNGNHTGNIIMFFSVILIFSKTTKPFNPIVSSSMNISNNIYNFIPIGHAITNIQNVQIHLRNDSTI